MFVLVSNFIAVKRHHDDKNSYKRKTFSWGVSPTVSEVQFIIMIV